MNLRGCTSSSHLMLPVIPLAQTLFATAVIACHKIFFNGPMSSFERVSDACTWQVTVISKDTDAMRLQASH